MSRLKLTACSALLLPSTCNSLTGRTRSSSSPQGLLKWLILMCWFMVRFFLNALLLELHPLYGYAAELILKFQSNRKCLSFSFFGETDAKQSWCQDKHCSCMFLFVPETIAVRPSHFSFTLFKLIDAETALKSTCTSCNLLMALLMYKCGHRMCRHINTHSQPFVPQYVKENSMNYTTNVKWQGWMYWKCSVLRGTVCIYWALFLIVLQTKIFEASSFVSCSTFFYSLWGRNSMEVALYFFHCLKKTNF